MRQIWTRRVSHKLQVRKTLALWHLSNIWFRQLTRIASLALTKRLACIKFKWHRCHMLTINQARWARLRGDRVAMETIAEWCHQLDSMSIILRSSQRTTQVLTTVDFNLMLMEEVLDLTPNLVLIRTTTANGWVVSNTSSVEKSTIKVIIIRCWIIVCLCIRALTIRMLRQKRLTSRSKKAIITKSILRNTMTPVTILKSDIHQMRVQNHHRNEFHIGSLQAIVTDCWMTRARSKGATRSSRTSTANSRSSWEKVALQTSYRLIETATSADLKSIPNPEV